jgi:hypothetical protein
MELPSSLDRPPCGLGEGGSPPPSGLASSVFAWVVGGGVGGVVVGMAVLGLPNDESDTAKQF